MRLDERAALIAQLGLPAQGPDVDLPDAALVLRAWHRWGERCVDFLRGDFAFVIADLEPRTAQIVKFEVKPLSLHAKTDTVDGFAERSLNSLTFSGNFSIRQMHEWMMMLFPNYTSHLPKDATSHSILFQNVFLGSGLSCDYREKQAVFMSDNISTVAILKEAVTTFATARNVRVSTRFEVSDTSVVDMLHR